VRAKAEIPAALYSRFLPWCKDNNLQPAIGYLPSAISRSTF